MCVVVSRFFSFNTQCWRCFRCSRHDLVGRMCRLENQDQEAPNIFRDILRLSSGVGQWAVGNETLYENCELDGRNFSMALKLSIETGRVYGDGMFFLAGREDAEGEFAGGEFVNGEYIE